MAVCRPPAQWLTNAPPLPPLHSVYLHQGKAQLAAAALEQAVSSNFAVGPKPPKGVGDI